MLGKLAVVDAFAQTLVEGVDCRLSQRVAVQAIHGLSELRGVPERAFGVFDKAFEPFIRPKPCAAAVSKLAADSALFLDDLLDAFFDQFVVLGMVRDGRGFRIAFGGLEDGKLRLSDAGSVFANPCQSVVALGGLEIDQHAFGVILFGLVRPC